MKFPPQNSSPNTQVIIMHIPELCYQDKLLEEKSRTRTQKYSGQAGPKNVAVCKRSIATFLANTELITPNFSGKLIISFKEGGISYIEKVEQIK
ncbi:MAG: hypothetical protein AB7D06_01950 [Pedobacter sp.]